MQREIHKSQIHTVNKKYNLFFLKTAVKNRESLYKCVLAVQERRPLVLSSYTLTTGVGAFMWTELWDTGTHFRCSTQLWSTWFRSTVLAETPVGICSTVELDAHWCSVTALMVQDIVAQLCATFLSALEGNLQYLPLFVEGAPALCHLPDSNLSDCVTKEI